MNDSISVFTDGGSRGNPGQAGIGVYIADSSNKEIVGFGKKLELQQIMLRNIQRFWQR